MKIKAIILFLAMALPGFGFADYADFGTTTKENKEGGFLVTGVFQGTPASTLGIAKGDVVTTLNGSDLKVTSGLSRLVAGVYAVGSEVTVGWKRGDEDMSGKVVLSESLSEEEFNERYPKKMVPTSRVKKSSGVVLDFKDVNRGGLADLKNLGLDVDELQKQLEKALDDARMGSVTSSASIVSITKISKSPSGNKITVSGSGGKQNVKIESQDGEIIFNESISKEELDKVPAADREFVKGMMGGMKVSVFGGSKKSSVEESVTDLLKKIEEEQKDK